MAYWPGYNQQADGKTNGGGYTNPYGGGGGGGGGWDYGQQQREMNLERMRLQNQLSQQQLQRYQGLPSMFSRIYGKLGGEQTAHQDWIRELMGLTRGTMGRITADLSRGLGSHLSRTNVSIPAGADVLARRYLSPTTQGLESQMAYLQQLLKQPQSRLGSAIGLTGQMAPWASGWKGQSLW